MISPEDVQPILRGRILDGLLRRQYAVYLDLQHKSRTVVSQSSWLGHVGCVGGHSGVGKQRGEVVCSEKRSLPREQWPGGITSAGDQWHAGPPRPSLFAPGGAPVLLRLVPRHRPVQAPPVSRSPVRSIGLARLDGSGDAGPVHVSGRPRSLRPTPRSLSAHTHTHRHAPRPSPSTHPHTLTQGRSRSCTRDELPSGLTYTYRLTCPLAAGHIPHARPSLAPPPCHRQSSIFLNRQGLLKGRPRWTVDSIWCIRMTSSLQKSSS